MLFRLHAAEIAEALVYDEFMRSDLEMLPGGWSVTYLQIRQFREGKPFYVFDDEDNRVEVENDAETYSGFLYYYRVWEMWHHFGLPQGGGWIDEPAWVLDVIRLMDGVYNEIQAYRMERRQRNWQRQ